MCRIHIRCGCTPSGNTNTNTSHIHLTCVPLLTATRIKISSRSYQDIKYQIYFFNFRNRKPSGFSVVTRGKNVDRITSIWVAATGLLSVSNWSGGGKQDLDIYLHNLSACKDFSWKGSNYTKCFRLRYNQEKGLDIHDDGIGGITPGNQKAQFTSRHNAPPGLNMQLRDPRAYEVCY
jgi:hypothetical protein